jgi:hypothetical protein
MKHQNTTTVSTLSSKKQDKNSNCFPKNQNPTKNSSTGEEPTTIRPHLLPNRQIKESKVEGKHKIRKKPKKLKIKQTIRFLLLKLVKVLKEKVVTVWAVEAHNRRVYL